MDTSSDIRSLLAELAQGACLSRDQTRQVFGAIMTGQAEDAQIGALLMALQSRPGGPVLDEIIGAAQVMRQHVRPITVPEGVEVIDVVGTGGDHSRTFNISTTAAMIAAAAGAAVVKHGNRSVTSKSGSSQVLEALGVKLEVDDATLEKCLAEARICFAYAPVHHPAMKHVAHVRKQIGFRTIFNLVGPLTNPAGARRQVIGVYDNALTEPFAQALLEMGSVHAMVVHGATHGSPDNTRGGSGLDEITTTGPTHITTLHEGRLEHIRVHPQDLGLPQATIADLQVDSVEESAQMVYAVLAGESGPARHIACLNAAAALVVADLVEDLKEGLARAAEAIDSRQALATLNMLIELSNG